MYVRFGKVVAAKLQKDKRVFIIIYASGEGLLGKCRVSVQLKVFN